MVNFLSTLKDNRKGTWAAHSIVDQCIALDAHLALARWHCPRGGGSRMEKHSLIHDVGMSLDIVEPIFL